ncbi:hypothetical protein IAG41_03700 [Sphingomonas sp. JC676]|uniref:hypothetical protein n=1 Tax=Sphingomonas sp. JC676 TaxID=2768065 RepID=UPI001658251F|nr:hypothetical protein [Sphingomonas sp. JC676]MBC9031488.1 hypothetical protein [Sphingomonas sp. JC676]
MSMLDGILGQVTQNVDIANLAAKLGLSPEHTESAVQALAQAHPLDSDTAETAAAQTGLPLEKLQEMITHIGGEGALGQFASLLQGQGGILGKVTGMLDKDGDGNPINDIAGMASGLFGGKQSA